MKKIVLIVLLVFSALLFVGCDVGQASTKYGLTKPQEQCNEHKYDTHTTITSINRFLPFRSESFACLPSELFPPTS